ncbi:hypothetical protein DTL75_24330 [Escherichia coli]|nr:hypothetical protein DTL75_24330 [Escherichia coli]
MYSQSLGQWNKLPPTVSHIRPDFPEPYESPSDGLRGKNEYYVYPAMIRIDYGQDFFYPTRT